MESNEKLMALIVMASVKFKKKSSAILRKHGLPFSHYCVLGNLVACEEGRDTVASVSKKMLGTVPGLTGIAKRMEQAGLIRRKPDDRDESLVLLQVTPRGLETHNAVRKIQEQHCRAYLEAFSLEQKEEVLSILKHIVLGGKHVPSSFTQRWETE